MPPDEKPTGNGNVDYFGKGYYHLYRNFLLGEDQTRAEVDFLLRRLHPRAGQRWLDMPCGYGRHLAELRRRRPSLCLAGGDLNLAYLRSFRQDLRAPHRSGPAPSTPLIAACDMRRLPFAGGTFHAVINMLNSFGYYPPGPAPAAPQWSDSAILAEFARVLRPGGALVMDLANRRALVDLVGRQPRIEYHGGEYAVVETFAWDPKSQILRNITRWRWPGGGERAGYRLRLYTPAQITRRLNRAGFAVRQMAGDFTGEPFDPWRSDRMLVVARKI